MSSKTGETAVAQETQAQKEEILDDDLCPVCQQHIYEQVKTTCDYIPCRFCMATWASVSPFQKHMYVVDINTDPAHIDIVSTMQARCPMCRDFTTALPDLARRDQLQAKYPSTYAECEALPYPKRKSTTMQTERISKP